MVRLPRKLDYGLLLKLLRGSLVGGAVWLSLQFAPTARFTPRLAGLEETAPVTISEVSSVSGQAISESTLMPVLTEE